MMTLMRLVPPVLAAAAVCALAALGFGAGCGGSDPGSAPVDAQQFPDGPQADGISAVAGLRLEYLDPERGPYSGGTRVLLRGNGFADDMTITFGGRMVEPLDVEVVDSRRCLVRTPPGTPGPADVTVTVGDETVTSPNGWSYEEVVVDPPTGAVAGGTLVVLRGLGTTFAEGDRVLFAGAPMTAIEVLSPTEIRGLTPPGTAGGADVTITGAWGEVLLEDGYTYATTGDAFLAGMTGGPIDGTLNVVVLDGQTEDGVDGAYVTVGDPATTPYQGTTDMFGQITFADPALHGPVTVTTSKEGYSRSSFVSFDATSVTIFLDPLPIPAVGPFPPGRQGGGVFGQIVFGDATTLGSPRWRLVPEPRTPTERKRAIVIPTVRSPFALAPEPEPTAIIDYVDDGSIAWNFGYTARPVAQAAVAIAGLYDEAIDPDGDGPLPPGRFEPFAMGVAREIVVGPGEFVEGVTIVVDTPLDTAIALDLDGVPPLNTPGQLGPTEAIVDVMIDLGGEGLIALPGASAAVPSGGTRAMISRMPALRSHVADGAYVAVAGAYAPLYGIPLSLRVVRGIRDVRTPIRIGDFLGTPRAIDPVNGGVASGPNLVTQPEGGTAIPSFTLHVLQGLDGTPLWTIVARGDQTTVPLDDLTGVGANILSLPDDQVFWVVTSATVPGLDFDRWSYADLSLSRWSAWATDTFISSVPFP